MPSELSCDVKPEKRFRSFYAQAIITSRQSVVRKAERQSLSHRQSDAKHHFNFAFLVAATQSDHFVTQIASHCSTWMNVRRCQNKTTPGQGKLREAERQLKHTEIDF